jgi:hypothetical protein
MIYGNSSQSKENQTVTSSSYGFFIYFFDEIRGHIPLFAYPKQLLEDEDEKQILSIHPAWWHQDKFLKSSKFTTIDLELEGIIYAATLFLSKTHRTKRRTGMNSEKWQLERFVLIVKAPSKVSFIAQEILHELKERIQEKIAENLCFLVDFSLKTNEESKSQDFLIKKVNNIQEELSDICQSLIPQIPISKLETILEEDQSASKMAQEAISSKKFQKLRFAIPPIKDTKIKHEGVNHQLEATPKRVKIVRIEQNNKLAKVIIRNESSIGLKNVLLKVYESRSFFGKSAQLSTINYWAPDENLSIEFEINGNDLATYFLRIEDEQGLIKLTRILG